MSRAEVDLRQAIESCYAAFARVPRPQKLDASPLEDAEAMLRALTSAPLRELTAEQLGRYSDSAILTIGCEDDYRHFLPRILELATDEARWLGFEPQIIASRLNMASWRAWPADEEAAVLHFFRTAFAAILERHPGYAHAGADWCCGLLILGESPSLTIARWRASASANAALHIAAFITDEAKNLRRHEEVRGAFWEEVSVEVCRELAKLLVSDETMDFLRSAAPRVGEQDRFQFLDAAEAELNRQF